MLGIIDALLRKGRDGMTTRAHKYYWNTIGQMHQRRRMVARWLLPIWIRLQQRRNGGVFAIDIHAHIGLFAQVNMGLRIASFCDAKGLRPCLSMTGPLYAGADGADVFETFFDNLALTESDRRRIASGRISVSRIEEIQDLGIHAQVFRGLTLERAHELVQRYMPPKAWLVRDVDIFVETHFGPGPVIGLHYRGTDKSSEAEPVSPSAAIDVVNQYLVNQPVTTTVFVSSDDQRFIDAAMSGIIGARVVVHDDEERSRDGTAVHTQSNRGDRARKAREAMMNCLLLSRCNVLIRTASFLSAWSSVFNPHLPVVLLNRPFPHTLWFPDSEIVKRPSTVIADGDASRLRERAEGQHA